jgi:hypothetical protein
MTETPDGLQAAELPIDPDSFGGVATEVGEQDETETPTGLDPRALDDFIGLMFLGYVEETCEVAGHHFRLRTPGHDERIERGELHRKYLNSMNQDTMWEMLTVAAYCIEIDGVPAPEPLGPKIGQVETRLKWIKDHIASHLVIRRLFEETLVTIDARERTIVEYLDQQSKS